MVVLLTCLLTVENATLNDHAYSFMILQMLTTFAGCRELHVFWPEGTLFGSVRVLAHPGEQQCLGAATSHYGSLHYDVFM